MKFTGLLNFDVYVYEPYNSVGSFTGPIVSANVLQLTINYAAGPQFFETY